jgi:hypothetical protein
LPKIRRKQDSRKGRKGEQRGGDKSEIQNPKNLNGRKRKHKIRKQIQMSKIQKFQTSSIWIAGFEFSPMLGSYGYSFVSNFAIRVSDFVSLASCREKVLQSFASSFRR